MSNGERPRSSSEEQKFRAPRTGGSGRILVEFPNRDPFFHNVFSLFEGKRFDLGLYEAGSTRNVIFDKPGISYIFCNIHSEMSAVVIAVTSPYYANFGSARGAWPFRTCRRDATPLRIWYEDALPEALNKPDPRGQYSPRRFEFRSHAAARHECASRSRKHVRPRLLLLYRIARARTALGPGNSRYSAPE